MTSIQIGKGVKDKELDTFWNFGYSVGRANKKGQQPTMVFAVTYFNLTKNSWVVWHGIQEVKSSILFSSTRTFKRVYDASHKPFFRLESNPCLSGRAASL